MEMNRDDKILTPERVLDHLSRFFSLVTEPYYPGVITGRLWGHGLHELKEFAKDNPCFKVEERYTVTGVNESQSVECIFTLYEKRIGVRFIVFSNNSEVGTVTLQCSYDVSRVDDNTKEDEYGLVSIRKDTGALTKPEFDRLLRFCYLSAELSAYLKSKVDE